MFITLTDRETGSQIIFNTDHIQRVCVGAIENPRAKGSFLVMDPGEIVEVRESLGLRYDKVAPPELVVTARNERPVDGDA
jgi:hypothetical protein